MTAITVLHGEADVRAAVGNDLGTTEWSAVTQAHLDGFREATGDPAGTYLAISLSNMLLPQIVEVRGFSMGVNYGTDAVTFGEPLRAGDLIRGNARLVDVIDVKGGIQTTMIITVEVASRGPACTIQSLSRWLGAEES